ncbi:unnamed protein product, partial [Ectocarpus sp. 12 AP-2014]
NGDKSTTASTTKLGRPTGRKKADPRPRLSTGPALAVRAGETRTEVSDTLRAKADGENAHLEDSEEEEDRRFGEQTRDLLKSIPTRRLGPAAARQQESTPVCRR